MIKMQTTSERLTNGNKPISSSEQIKKVTLMESLQQVVKTAQNALQGGAEAVEVHGGEGARAGRGPGGVVGVTALQGHGFDAKAVEQAVVAVRHLGSDNQLQERTDGNINEDNSDNWL